MSTASSAPIVVSSFHLIPSCNKFGCQSLMLIDIYDYEVSQFNQSGFVIQRTALPKSLEIC